MPTHKPSDYARPFRKPEPAAEPHSAEQQPEATGPGMELATFRLLYESDRICLFETRDGHLTAVDVNRLA